MYHGETTRAEPASPKCHIVSSPPRLATLAPTSSLSHRLLRVLPPPLHCRVVSIASPSQLLHQWHRRTPASQGHPRKSRSKVPLYMVGIRFQFHVQTVWL